jgi:hypothetical protein
LVAVPVFVLNDDLTPYPLGALARAAACGLPKANLQQNGIFIIPTALEQLLF